MGLFERRPAERAMTQWMSQLFRYVLVGGVSAAIDIASLWLLLELGTPRPLALGVALVAGMVVNYPCHRFTFRSVVSVGLRSITLYLVAVGGNYLLTLMIVEAGVVLGFAVIPSKIPSRPIIALTGFFHAQVRVPIPLVSPVQRIAAVVPCFRFAHAVRHARAADLRQLRVLVHQQTGRMRQSYRTPIRIAVDQALCPA